MRARCGLYNKDLFINLYTEAREHAYGPKVIQTGFKITGLVPLNAQEVCKRLPQEDRSTTPEPELPELGRPSPKTPKNTQQLPLQIDLLGTVNQNPTSETRLCKFEKVFVKLHADNVLLNQQNLLLFSENRARKIRKTGLKRRPSYVFGFPGRQSGLRDYDTFSYKPK